MVSFLFFGAPRGSFHPCLHGLSDFIGHVETVLHVGQWRFELSVCFFYQVGDSDWGDSFL